MVPVENDAYELSAAIFRMVSSFRRQRGEVAANGALKAHPESQVAARHMGAAEKVLEEGPLTIGALAALMGVEVTTASKIATELEDAGVVQRTRDPRDRRRILLDVVPDQRERVKTFMTELRAPLVRAVEKLTAEEVAGFRRGLQFYADALDATEILSPPDPGPEPGS